jgi:hypothetical protein
LSVFKNFIITTFFILAVPLSSGETKNGGEGKVATYLEE